MTYPTTRARIAALTASLALVAPAAASAETDGTGGAAFDAAPAAAPAAVSPVEVPAGKALLAGSRQRVTVTVPAGATEVQVVRVDDGTVVRRWSAADAAVDGVIRWDGTVRGQPVKTGSYAFTTGTTAQMSRRSATRATKQTLSSGAGEAFEVVDATFPIRGKYDIRTAYTNGFGGGRGHQGHDVFAKCGTPLVAARPGRVMQATWQSAAGNYVVLQDAEGSSYAYMHMREPSELSKGDRVRAGEVVGYVGDTGRASGCHLHFERWTAPGWYAGGEAFDPLPDLKRWDAWS